MAYFTRLTFRVVAHTHLGEAVYVVGDCPSLGCWEPLQGVPLETDAESYPVWRNREPVSLPSDTRVEYKYVLVNSATGELRGWEGIEGNRALMPEGEEMVADDVMHEPPEEGAGVAMSAAALAVGTGDVGDTDSGADAVGPLPTEQQPRLKTFVDEMRELEVDETDAVMVVSYVLPVLISRVPPATPGGAVSWDIEWNHDSIVAKKHRSLTDAMRVVWVGCPHMELRAELPAAERESLAEALRPFHCVPVFVPAPLHEKCYFDLCRRSLWPTFHNVVRAYARPSESFSMDAWRAYTAVNRSFSDKVMEVYEPGDVVWVHDYHLLLLPSFILRKLRTASVGLFLHTPFPSSDIFRTIPVRDELLRGMLNADLIGFHLYEYARSFLTCCKRMLGLEYDFVPGGFLAVRDQKRTVMVQASHVGIEPEVVAPYLRPVDAAGVPPGLETSAPLVQAVQSGRVLIGGIDECERLRGITLKHLAFEQLLETKPEWKGRVVFVQILVGARNFLPARDDDSASVRSELRAIAERVNALAPGSVVIVDVPTVSLAQRMAVWASLKVAIFSSVREGVNTYPLEYVYARSGEHAGVVVLSEFCSCAHVLNGALRVNVWSTDELMASMLRALTMDAAERVARQQRDLIFVVSNTTSSWAERFFVDLKTVGSRSLKSAEQPVAIGFGLAGFRCVGMGGMRTLEVTDVLSAYRKTVRRAIFVDWGGTLVPNDDRPLTPSLATEEYAMRSLPQSTHHCLEELCHDPRNFVMVVSGLERQSMDQVFGQIPGVSLAAEHGLLYKVGSVPGANYRGTGHWEQIIESFNDDWRDLAQAIVETYAMRTNGSYVQKKGSSIVWRYEEADLEFGSLQAKEMREHLDNLLQGYPVAVNPGKGYVEIKPAGVDKGVIVQHMLDHLCTYAGGVDFVLCLGDDSADENMFAALNKRFGVGTSGAAGAGAGAAPGVSTACGGIATGTYGASGAGGPNHVHVFCATVGRKPSNASFYVNDHEEVLELLQSLRLHSTRSNRNRSLTDLNRLGHHPAGGHAVRASDAANPPSGGGSFNVLRTSGGGAIAASLTEGRVPSYGGSTAGAAGPLGPLQRAATQCGYDRASVLARSDERLPSRNQRSSASGVRAYGPHARRPSVP